MNDRITHECAKGVSNKYIAAELGVSTSTVERQLHRNHEDLVAEQISYSCPHVLGIDEHSIHRGRTRGHKFAVTLTDLKNHRVYEIFEGKESKTLEENLRKLKGRENVKVVCMDLCPAFRKIVRRCFPNAKIVADRFHVIRVVNRAFLDFCRQAEPDIRWQRGIVGALRTKGKKLKASQRTLLKALFAKNPAIQTAYEFKEELCELLNHKAQTKNKCADLITKLREKVWYLLNDAPKIFQELGKTIRFWFVPIICMWRFTKSNGITEGFHRLMKLIQRRAFGYRNFKNYRLRVLIVCGCSKVRKMPFHKIWA